MHKPLPQTHPRLYAWLKGMHEQMWSKHEQTTCGGYTMDWYSETQYLSPQGWKKILTAIKSGRVVITLSDQNGFVLGVHLWSYPVRASEKPERLMCVTNNHIKDMRSGLNAASGGFWDVIEPFAFSDENKRAVEFLDLPPLRSKAHYAY